MKISYAIQKTKFLKWLEDIKVNDIWYTLTKVKQKAKNLIRPLLCIIFIFILIKKRANIGFT